MAGIRIAGILMPDMITMVAAVADNGVLGLHGALPWRLKTDMQHFRKVTDGHTVVMGRRTFLSIVNNLGTPLPGRRNIVMSHSLKFNYPDVTVVHSAQEVLSIRGDVDIIGGGQVYTLFLDVADRLNLTEVHARPDGDTLFPAIDPRRWREISRDSHPADEQNEYSFDFVVYERIR